MKSWVKLYTEINHDPTIGVLSWADRGIWSALLALAGEIDARDEQDRETGELDTLENVAWRLRCEPAELSEAMMLFQKQGMVEDRDGVLFVSDWCNYLPSTRLESAVGRWRTLVFERDKYACQDCGARGVKLNAHHIKPWFVCVDGRFDPDNGITLCKKCHYGTHGVGWKRKAGR